MVAIKSLVSFLAMALVANAAPSVDIEARQAPGPGESVAGLKFFGPTNHNCESGGPIVANFNVFVPPRPTGDHLINTCYDAGSYGSVFIENIRAPCRCKFSNTVYFTSSSVEVSTEIGILSTYLILPNYSG